MRQVLARPFSHSLALLGALALLAACGDPVQPGAVAVSYGGVPASIAAADLMARYVALGTSNSQGVHSAGINASGQRAAWPAQLAARAGVPFAVPLIADPGCSPPLLPPLAADMALVAVFGSGLIDMVMTTCAPLQAGVTLPGGNLAISGSKARDALYSSIETQSSDLRRELYRRVLLPGFTQVTQMQAMHPTFVSVELAANEVLPATTGRFAATTPYAEWQPVYDQILDGVQASGASGAALVGLPNNAANFPSVRRAPELFNQWAYLLTLGITVSFNCSSWGSNRNNYIFIPGYILTLLSKTPTTATCADVPGASDYVLTPSDMSNVNALMATMNAHIQAQATSRQWAYFSLDALYGLPKPALDMYKVLFSNTPFGANISLDGVHPSAQGQAILAAAAAQAINAKYGTGIP